MKAGDSDNSIATTIFSCPLKKKACSPPVAAGMVALWAGPGKSKLSSAGVAIQALLNNFTKLCGKPGLERIVEKLRKTQKVQECTMMLWGSGMEENVLPNSSKPGTDNLGRN